MCGNTVIGLERRDQNDAARAKSVLRLHYNHGGVLAIAADRDTLDVTRELEHPPVARRIVEVLHDEADELVVRFEDDSELVITGANLEISDQSSIP